MRLTTVMVASMAAFATWTTATPSRVDGVQPAEALVRRCEQNNCDEQQSSLPDDTQDMTLPDSNNYYGSPETESSPDDVTLTGYGDHNYGSNGFDASMSSAVPDDEQGGEDQGDENGQDFTNQKQQDFSCPTSFLETKAGCCYDAYGNLAVAKLGCPGEVLPFHGQRKEPFVCNPENKSSDFIIDVDALNCLDICILSRNCKRKRCKVSSPRSSNIIVKALNCVNLNLLSSNDGD